MICKEDFVNIINSTARTLRCVQELEKALGGVDLMDGSISDYLNKGDVIAIHFLEMKTPENEEMDAYVQCYWNLIQGDESILTFASGEQTVIYDSDMFYDFWVRREENLPIACDIYKPTPKGTYSWE